MSAQHPLYPKASTGETRGVPASPRFPQIEERVLEYWKQDGTFQASIDQRPATCSPATSRTSWPASRRSRAVAWSAASAGTPTACPRSSRP